jgi:mannose-6-phosphate isomerase-like protein (cupin superfamily)
MEGVVVEMRLGVREMVRLGMWLAAVALLSAASPSAAEIKAAPPPMPAQGFATEPRTFASSAEIAGMIAKAKATIKPDQPNLVQPLLQFAPYQASLEYRQAGAGAAVHRDDAEFFYVIEGGGNLIEGGELLDPTPGGGRNISGKAIIGGTSRHVAAGDVLVVPQGAPHQFDRVDGLLVMIAMKVPMPPKRQSAAP